VKWFVQIGEAFDRSVVHLGARSLQWSTDVGTGRSLRDRSHDGIRRVSTEPFEPVGFVRRIGPFAFVALAVPLVVIVSSGAAALSWLLASFVAVVAAIVLSVVFATRPVPRVLHLAPPLSYLVALCCLRAALGPGHVLLGALVVLPVIWSALYYRRWEMMIVLAASGATLVVGAAMSSSGAELAAAVVMTSVAFVAGHTVDIVVDLLERESRSIAGIVDNALDAFVEFDETGRILAWNAYAERLFGWRPDDASGRVVADSIMSPATRMRLDSALTGGPRGGRCGTVRSCRVLAPARRRDGGEFLAAWGVTVVDAAGSRRYHAFVQDVEERERAREALHASESRFRSAFEMSPIGMMITALDGSIETVNDALCAQLGYDRTTLCNTSLRDLTDPTDPTDRALDALEMRRLIAGRMTTYAVEKRYRHANGEMGWAHTHLSVLPGADGRPARLLGQILDVTEQRRLDEQLRELADSDPLTGLLNRRAFERETNRHLVDAAHCGSNGALMVVVLDNLEQVTDVFGHGAGDALIVAVADVLSRLVRGPGVIGRVGGHEFALLVRDIDEQSAIALATSVLEAVRDVAARVSRVPITFSVGVAIADDAIAQGAEWFARADAAMHCAKRAGTNRSAVHRADLAAGGPCPSCDGGGVGTTATGVGCERLDSMPFGHLGSGRSTGQRQR
jgi:diguanylate cyclase (GGDEF)-like protein/PAS domain S-box-containing protein